MLKKFVLGGMVVVAALLGNACGDDSSAQNPTAPNKKTSSSSYFCSLNGKTYQTESAYRRSCITNTTPTIQSSSSIISNSSIIYSSTTFPSSSSIVSLQNVLCFDMNFQCAYGIAVSAKQDCDNLEQYLAANGMLLSSGAIERSIQLMVSYNCKCESIKTNSVNGLRLNDNEKQKINDYMASLDCLK